MRQMFAKSAIHCRARIELQFFLRQVERRPGDFREVTSLAANLHPSLASLFNCSSIPSFLNLCSVSKGDIKRAFLVNDKTSIFLVAFSSIWFLCFLADLLSSVRFYGEQCCCRASDFEVLGGISVSEEEGFVTETGAPA